MVGAFLINNIKNKLNTNQKQFEKNRKIFIRKLHMMKKIKKMEQKSGISVKKSYKIKNLDAKKIFLLRK